MDLTAFLVAVLVAMAHGLTLQEEIRLAPGYSDLTDCQQYCIAGRLSWDIVTDVASWATLSTCSTKTCICAPERRTAAETLIGACQKGFICAGSTVEQNGAAVRWVAGYCDWGTVMTPTLPVSSTIVTSPVSQGPDVCYLPLTILRIIKQIASVSRLLVTNSTFHYLIFQSSLHQQEAQALRTTLLAPL